MSDTHAAAPAPAPAAPPPAAPAEAVINPNPVQSPSPIGSQAPEKPAPPEPRPQSRRETIERAFERAEQKGRPGPAQARMGHNNPPEPTEKERTRPDPIDLKKRPADQPPPRERGEHGHFAARSPAEGQPAAERQQPGDPNRPAAPPLPTHAPFREPPNQRGWSDAARAEWANTPESVRGDVHRMNHEFARYYHQTRADAAVMNSIRHFVEMARQHGTTIDQAMTNYVGMEQKLRGDPIGGLDQLVYNMNLQTQNGHRITLRDIAHYVLNQSPEQHQFLQSRNLQSAQQYQMGQLLQQQNQLAHELRRMQYHIQLRHSRRTVDRFAEQHPRTDELADAIKREIDLGFNLPTAYRRAELLYPATHAAQTRATSAQTRTVDRSISGAPNGGPLNGSGRRQKPSATPRDAVLNALRRVNGSI